jgi:signal transduction histidine kinase
MPETSNPPGRDPATSAQARRAATLLMGMAAHDLRTPLSAMSGWLQVLTSGRELPAATRESALKGLQAAVIQQLALADGMSQLSAIEAGKAGLEISPVDVNASVETAAAGLAQEAGSRMVELRVAKADAQVHLLSDRGLVEMLLRYLFAGALKFAAKTSLLTVAAQGLAADGLNAKRGCSIRVDIGLSFLPATGIDALLRHLRGVEGAEPTGTGAAFALAVAQRMILFLQGNLQVEAGAGPQQVVLIAFLPDLARNTP